MNRIREARKQSGIKQTDLCVRLGISQGALSGWENGKYDPGSAGWIALSKTLGVSIDYLMGVDTLLVTTIELSSEAQKIGAAYDKATPKEQQLVRLTLEEYMSEAPVRVAALSRGEPVDLSGADPDAPIPGGFNPGQDIP